MTSSRPGMPGRRTGGAQVSGIYAAQLRPLAHCSLLASLLAIPGESVILGLPARPWVLPGLLP